MVSYTFAHPLRSSQFLDELNLDVRDNSITKLFGFFGERFLHKEFTKDPTCSNGISSFS